MSTALVHGLADPKARGKPVGNANQGRPSPSHPTREGSSRLIHHVEKGGGGWGGNTPFPLSPLCLWRGKALKGLSLPSSGSLWEGAVWGHYQDIWASPVPKGSPVNIPESERWMGCPPLCRVGWGCPGETLLLLGWNGGWKG